MVSAIKWVGPLNLGLVVMLALKAADIFLPTPYHHFWVYATPGEEIPEYSPFHMVRAGSAFVMWVANELLFWPYLVCWIDALMVGEDRATLDGPRAYFLCQSVMFVFGFKHPAFGPQVLFSLFDFVCSSWPVLYIFIILMGLGAWLRVLYYQGCTFAARVGDVMFIPLLAFSGSGVGQSWEFNGVLGVIAILALSTGLALLRKMCLEMLEKKRRVVGIF